jgi:hypothetical protein
MSKEELEDKTNKKEIEIGNKLSRVIIIALICATLAFLFYIG